MQNELEKALENKFFCPSRFAQEIESLVHTGDGMSYIDAVVHFCDNNSIDVESVPKLIILSACGFKNFAFGNVVLICSYLIKELSIFFNKACLLYTSPSPRD